MATGSSPLLAAGDAAFEAACTPWNLYAAQRPAAAATPRSASEVAEAVRAGRERGLRVLVLGTGHGAGQVSSDDNLLIRTGALDSVSVDPVARTARVGAGAMWGAVNAAAAEHGLAGAAGSSAGVGVVGYMLGGGHSWLSSRTGLACNDLRAAEVVTADGGVRRIDDESDPEAMWALRGGGGGFAAITEIEVGLHELGEVAGGSLMWPAERAAEILEAWRAWSEDLPEGVTTVGRVLRFPPFEMVPEPVRGRAFVIVEAVDLTGIERLGGLVAPLRAMGPELDTLRPMPPAGLAEVHMDPPDPSPATGTGAVLAGFGPDVVEAAARAISEGPAAALIGLELRKLGGAVTAARAPGVRTSTDAPVVMFAIGMCAGPELTAASLAGVAAVREALLPLRGAQGILNFYEGEPRSAVFSPDELDRLRAVAGRLDPDGVFISRA